jgi:FkbM family methyltransferase
MSHFYSQCGEDRWMDENDILPAKGIFCEVGVLDGIACSNTFFLEQIGWTGMLVEPDPVSAAKAMENRTARVWCCAAGAHPDSGVFYVNEADRGSSGLTRPGVPRGTIILPLSFLIAESGFTDLDFLSIDTEGTELDVWEGIGIHRPPVVMMEYQTWDLPPKDKEIVERMVRDGYREIHRTQFNLIFQLR